MHTQSTIADREYDEKGCPWEYFGFVRRGDDDDDDNGGGLDFVLYTRADTKP